MKQIDWFLSGGMLPWLLILCGIFFFFYLRGLPWRHPIRMLRSMAGHKGDGISPFRTVTLALAGTLGVGNIVGVANAITVGGAGAIFWMWVSALAAMILKYAEILLAVRHRRTRADGSHYGGAVYYIKDCFSARGWHRTGKALALLFGCLIVGNAVTMGSVIQVHAVAAAFDGVLGFSPLLCGLLLFIIVLPLIRKGASGLSALTEYLVPIMSGGYLVLSLAVLLLRREAVGSAFEEIFRSALTAESVTGGALGVLTSAALRTGTMRGLLSNEAGCGTAPTAHAAADTDSPAAQGVWGIFEVFVDTVLLCTLTALVILVSPFSPDAFGSNAVLLTVRAYSSVLGEWSELFFCAAILCFGYATVLCWCGYGAEGLDAITKSKKAKPIYRVLFLLSIPLGCVAAPSLVWKLSDYAITVLTTINLLILLLMRREIRWETRRQFSVDKR